MNLLTKISIALIILLSIATTIFFVQWQKNKDRADRMSLNYKEVVNENNELNLAYEELNVIQKERIDNVIDSLKVKVKRVKEYVYIHTTDTIHDTIQVQLTIIEPFTYEFTKDTACFHVQGLVNNKNEVPILQFTKLDYNNTVEYLIYQQRRKWKFLFIKSRFLGKKENKLETISKCGESTVQKINLIKK